MGGVVAITAAVSILVTSAVCGIVLWCLKSRMRSETRSESELVHRATPDPSLGQVQQVMHTDNSALGDVPQATLNAESMQEPTEQNVQKLNTDLIY